MEFLSIVNSLGPTALIILLLVLNFSYIKQSKEKTESINKAMDSQSLKHIAEMEELRNLVKTLADSHKEDIKTLNILIQSTNEAQKDADRRQDEQIQYLQLHYVPKEDMFTQFGGWRTEIGEVRKSINHLTELVGTIKGDKR